MFNFIYYGYYDNWSFYPSTETGAQHIDLTEEGIKKYILPKIKEDGYRRMVSMKDVYGSEFKNQFLKMQKQLNEMQVCEIKEDFPEDGYTLTYFVFVAIAQYESEYDQQDFIFNIFAFQDFYKKDTTNPDDLPI